SFGTTRRLDPHPARFARRPPPFKGRYYGECFTMLALILKRLVLAVPSLLGVIVVTFLLTRALPGDPAAYFAGPAATNQAIEQIRVKLGLDKSLSQQFVYYVRDLARGDLGMSLTTGPPVAPEIKNPLPAPAALTLLGLSVPLAISL